MANRHAGNEPSAKRRAAKTLIGETKRIVSYNVDTVDKYKEYANVKNSSDNLLLKFK